MAFCWRSESLPWRVLFNLHQKMNLPLACSCPFYGVNSFPEFYWNSQMVQANFRV